MSIVVLISGSGTNLQAIIDAGIPISLVISNEPNALGLKRAHAAGIPTVVIPHREFMCREDFDANLLSAIKPLTPELVVLAGFMRILSAGFVNALKGTLINIHPSLLPQYRGCNTHQRALEAGEKEHGTTVHYVTETLDGGPIISQSSLKIHPNDTPDTLRSRIQILEHQLYPQTIQLIRGGRVTLIQATVVFDGKAIGKSGIILN